MSVLGRRFECYEVMILNEQTDPHSGILRLPFLSHFVVMIIYIFLPFSFITSVFHWLSSLFLLSILWLEISSIPVQ